MSVQSNTSTSQGFGGGWVEQRTRTDIHETSSSAWGSTLSQRRTTSRSTQRNKHTACHLSISVVASPFVFLPRLYSTEIEFTHRNGKVTQTQNTQHVRFRSRAAAACRSFLVHSATECVGLCDSSGQCCCCCSEINSTIIIIIIIFVCCDYTSSSKSAIPHGRR